MLRLYARPYTHAVAGLAGMRAWFSDRPKKHRLDHALLQAQLLAMEPDIDSLPLSDTLKGEFERLLKYCDLTDGTPEDNKTLGTYLQAFLLNLESAMENIVCLIVDESRCELYEQRTPPFGSDVAAGLPEANYDTAAAARCLALEEWTASVFHCTRALELGLRKLARRLRIPGVEYKEWYRLIRDIGSKIDALKTPVPGKPLQPRQRRRIEWLSEMSAGFTYFKDAWRNPVSHSRAKYDGREADDAWNHVQSFMRILVRGPR